MIWMALFGVIMVVMLYLLWHVEQVGKTNRGLKAKLAAREQEILKLQQATYQLAEQQKSVLEQKLGHVTVNSMLSAHELQVCKLLCSSLPVVVKEYCSKGLTPQQAMATQIRRQSIVSASQLEYMMQKHARLTTLWNTNSVTSHLQLCSVVVSLALEQVPAKVSNLEAAINA